MKSLILAVAVLIATTAAGWAFPPGAESLLSGRARAPNIVITDHGGGIESLCANNGSSLTSCPGPTFSSIPAGRIAVIETQGCVNNCTQASGQQLPVVSSITNNGTATFGSCQRFNLNGGHTDSNQEYQTEAWWCMITAGGSVTAVANFNIPTWYAEVWIQFVSGATGDDGIGFSTNAGSDGIPGTAPSVTTAGPTTKTTGNGDLCISVIINDGEATGGVTLNETPLDYTTATSTPSGSQYQYAGNTPTRVTATGSYPPPGPNWTNMIICLK